MLVLTRKPGQSVIIYDPKTFTKIEVIVSEVRGDNVRIGFIAPADVVIDRAEVADSKHREAEAAGILNI